MCLLLYYPSQKYDVKKYVIHANLSYARRFLFTTYCIYSSYTITFQDADADVKKYKKALDASKAKWSEREAEEDRLKMEIEELRKTIDEADHQLKSCDDAFKGTLYTIYILGYRKTAHKSMTRYS